MSRPVDVLAVLDSARKTLWDSIPNRASWTDEQLSQEDDIREARAAVAELIEATEAYAEAEAALAGRELEGINAESIDRLQPRVHATRRDLESALARVRGAA